MFGPVVWGRKGLSAALLHMLRDKRDVGYSE